MEVKSRAEEYLNYALKNQETYPKPFARLDYYLLSLAQEVRSGGADPATITTAVNNYLAANPVQAMSDSDIAASVNKSINDGSINVMSEVEDGSITEDKLDDNLFDVKYILSDNVGNKSQILFPIKDFNKYAKNNGNYSYKVSFIIKNNYDLANLRIKAKKAGYTTFVEFNTQLSLPIIKNKEIIVSYEIEDSKLIENLVLINDSGLGGIGLDGTIESLVLTIDSKKVEFDIPVATNTSSAIQGSVDKKIEKGILSTKEQLNSSMSELNEKMDNIPIYNFNNNVYGNKYKIKFTDVANWVYIYFNLQDNYKNCTLDFSCYVTMDKTQNISVGSERYLANKATCKQGEKTKLTRKVEIGDTNINKFVLTTPDGMPYDYSGTYEDITIKIDGKIVPFTVTTSVTTATVEKLDKETGYLYTQQQIDLQMSENKEKTINNVSEMMCYPLDKSVNPPSDFLNGAVLNFEISNISSDIVNQGIYIYRLNNSCNWGTVSWLTLKYGDGKDLLMETTGGGAKPQTHVGNYVFKNDLCTVKLTIDFSKIEGNVNTTYTKEQTLISRNCIKKLKASTKTTLPFVNSIYVTQGSSRPHAVPLFLDYLYDGRKDKILFENGDDRYYIRGAVGSPNKQDTNIVNKKKTLKLKSDTLDVDPLSFNVVSIEEKTVTEPVKILTIGDSVTAGAITDKQYWAFCNEFFALEDLNRNRTTDIMFLGSRNNRETTVTKGEKSKTVKSFACGVSSWSLKSWMTHKESDFVYFEDDDTEQSNPIFSIKKWIERYRTHTDEGVALSIGDEGIGTKITENNISKIQCCTPNIIYINSTHNDYGDCLSNLKIIIKKIRAELPDVKIVVASPMGITGTWHKDKYINKDWIDSSEITGPNFNWGGAYGKARLDVLRYFTEQEKLDDWLYVMPQMVIQPTVESLSYEEVDCGVKTMKQPNKINQMATIHPGTITHQIWGYEMYCLLKYIFRSSDTTTNEVIVTLDNTELSIIKGNTSQLTATPSVADTKVTFSSSDETIATVDSSGLVTAISGGTAYIYAETSTSILPTVCKVTIISNVESISFNSDSDLIEINEQKQLQYTILPLDATNKKVIFDKDNNNITLTDEGIITGVTEGTTIVTITTDDGSFTDTITINVVSKLTLDSYNSLMSISSNWKQGEYGVGDGKFTTGDGTRIAYNRAIKVDPSTKYLLTTNNSLAKFVVRALKSDGSFDKSFGAVDNGSSITTTSTTDTLVMTIYAPAGGKYSNDLLQMISDGTVIPTIAKVTE